MKYLLSAALLFTAITAGFTQGNEMQETVSIIKKNFASSKENIKKYEWIETTTTYVKGEEKSKKQNQCYYGVDGKLTKVETGGSMEAKKKGGIRGKIADNKKEDMKEYIETAIEKIHTYLPPDAGKIQEIYGAGNAVIHVLEPGKKFKIDFPDYLQKGDMLSVSVDKEHKLIMALAVNTYIDDPSEKVIFDIAYNTIPDGTQYPSTTSLDAQGKKVKIVIENSGYKKGAGK